MEELLVTKGLTKQFGFLTAVNEVDLVVNKDVVTGVIGPNGSGKTTLFNLLSGLHPVTAGQIIFEGEDITDLAPHERVDRGIARSFQLVSIFPHLRVWENLVLGTLKFREKKLNTGLSFFLKTSERKEIKENCLEALKIVGLEDKAEQEAGNLPYGEQRLLEIGISLSLRARLLLLDEPFAGLNDYEINFVLKVLERVRENVDLVIIDHKISKILDLVDHLCAMDRGKIICQGKPHDVINNDEVRKCYWGEAS